MKIIYFLRSVVMTINFIFSTLFFSVLGILNSIILNNKKYNDIIISSWAKSACFLFNVQIKVHNPEHIPTTGSVFLFNHSSFFDIFALAATIPDIRFGAKIELFSIPIFGQAIRRVGTLPIARGSREEVFKVYSEARVRIKNNERFALSAEGGRFYGENLSSFKAGPFVFAITSGAVIAPVIIKGAHECLPKSKILANTDRWGQSIDLIFLKPIDVEGYDVENRQQLQKNIYEKMNTEWIST